MTVEDLKEALEAFIKNELPELQKMEDYYTGKHNILNKKDSDIYLDGRVWRVGVERKF